jgi:hypothetical protein
VPSACQRTQSPHHPPPPISFPKIEHQSRLSLSRRPTPSTHSSPRPTSPPGSSLLLTPQRTHPPSLRPDPRCPAAACHSLDHHSLSLSSLIPPEPGSMPPKPSPRVSRFGFDKGGLTLAHVSLVDARSEVCVLLRSDPPSIARPSPSLSLRIEPRSIPCTASSSDQQEVCSASFHSPLRPGTDPGQQRSPGAGPNQPALHSLDARLDSIAFYRPDFHISFDPPPSAVRLAGRLVHLPLP